MLAVINAICLLAALAALLRALANRRQNPSTQENRGNEHAPALEHDESLAATLHASAFQVSLLFSIAILFNTVSLGLISRCAQI